MDFPSPLSNEVVIFFFISPFAAMGAFMRVSLLDCLFSSSLADFVCFLPLFVADLHLFVRFLLICFFYELLLLFSSCLQIWSSLKHMQDKV
uniref:Uncharacterized protein n=1 Tax=Manihot esculenta TaxID=3983 RepID=A0A2C9UWN0_MANES